jgi:hypothetical protein
MQQTTFVVHLDSSAGAVLSQHPSVTVTFSTGNTPSWGEFKKALLNAANLELPMEGYPFSLVRSESLERSEFTDIDILGSWVSLPDTYFL